MHRAAIFRSNPEHLEHRVNRAFDFGGNAVGGFFGLWHVFDQIPDLRLPFIFPE
jgi:hypothetical protein